jgi:formylglycine-generating enzyme required for sulfatase activity
MCENLILIKKDDKIIKSDFMIAQYPVTIKEFQEIFEKKAGDQEHEKYIKESTWMAAIKYCNLLNIKKGLPLSYNETTGELIDENGKYIEEVLEVEGFRFPSSRVKGFRLPTSEEWEYAAKGWSSEIKTGSYIRILQEIYKDWNMDTRCSEIEKMKINTIGLFGMLENREWYSDNKNLEGLKNKMCFWEEYICNYNNDLSYKVVKKIGNDTELTGFRVALSNS